DIMAAASAVGAVDMISRLPGGFDHEVAERGRNLSAGQRQLIALARAYLVDPDILLLDEATAALDLVSEAAVARAAERLLAARTTLVVAHRLTTAARADPIVVLDQARVAESGLKADLLAAGVPYASLWDASPGDATLAACPAPPAGAAGPPLARREAPAAARDACLRALRLSAASSPTRDLASSC